MKTKKTRPADLMPCGSQGIEFSLQLIDNDSARDVGKPHFYGVNFESSTGCITTQHFTKQLRKLADRLDKFAGEHSGKVYVFEDRAIKPV